MLKEPARAGPGVKGKKLKLKVPKRKCFAVRSASVPENTEVKNERRYSKGKFEDEEVKELAPQLRSQNEK